LNLDPDRTVARHVLDAANIGNWYSFRRSFAGLGTTVAVFLDRGRTYLLGAIVIPAP